MPSPSPIKLATNLVSAIAKETAAIATGKPGVTDEEIMERMDACRACEMYDDQQNRCKACGCFLNAKALFRSAECDLGKWRPL